MEFNTQVNFSSDYVKLAREQNPSNPAPAILPGELPGIFSGSTLTVGTAGVDVSAALAKLRLMTSHTREENASRQMSAAISAVLGRMELADAEQKALVEKLGDLIDQATELKEEGLLIIEARDSDPRIKTLEMKVKELEEAVERMRKTPEEHKEELEEKERELEEAQKALADVKAEYQQKLDAVEAKLVETEAAITETQGKLDAEGRKVFSTALNNLLLDFIGQAGEAAEADDEKTRTKVMSGVITLAKLLSGVEDFSDLEKILLERDLTA